MNYEHISDKPHKRAAVAGTASAAMQMTIAATQKKILFTIQKREFLNKLRIRKGIGFDRIHHNDNYCAVCLVYHHAPCETNGFSFRRRRYSQRLAQDA